MGVDRPIFLKLGGSLLTDKTAVEAVRGDVVRRLADEIAAARVAQPGLSVLLGHGSGSFGHVAALKYGTRYGVATPIQWLGFAEVAAAAARLNTHLREALLAAGVPAITFFPGSSADCVDGRLVGLAVAPLQRALMAGLLPVVMGDVALDRVRGGTIVSTEELFSHLVRPLQPRTLLLAGETEGVYDGRGRVIGRIESADFDRIRSALHGSRGADVTGGMAGKVTEMLALVNACPGLSVRIFSGLVPGNLLTLLLDPDTPLGTLITA
jgi:isopentenyl phosphate kinase